VRGRPDDLIGLVAFANYPDLACPPTLDHAFLLEAVRTLRTARPGDDGTNIGDAIAWALDALRGRRRRRRC
jgi:Ca-activated chloride channel family protein